MQEHLLAEQQIGSPHLKTAQFINLKKEIGLNSSNSAAAKGEYRIMTHNSNLEANKVHITEHNDETNMLNSSD